MRNKRIHIITKRTFLGSGVEQDADTWFKRFQQCKQDLERDIPTLKSLQASTLSLGFAHTPSGATLIARLEESEQLTLADHRGGNAMFDLFDSDIRRVTQDQRSIELNLTLAQSAAVDPFKDPSVIDSRERLRSASTRGELTISSTPEAKSMSLFECPKYLPNSPFATGEIRVLHLSPSEAEVMLLADLYFSTPDERVIPSKTKLRMSRRNGHQSVASGAKLQYAMDSRINCEVMVAVLLDWGNGEISHLELLKFSNEAK
jgi:hypothetical protein